ncbi:MAG: alpha/beta hydrolase [Candidatus Paracaedibacteraceae bacterium]|nr:alpha/beta hydrolase [Candidatus Paracaedibacteraceae bacterium]
MITKKTPTIHNYLGKNPVGFHTITYYTWGNPLNPALLMVHGLSRNGRDYDVLAEALSDYYYVVCPDIVGRGLSDWLPEGVEYSYTQYMADLTGLIARLNVTEVSWLGSSMGALLGMIMASLQGTPIKRLIMNDIGPFISSEALEKIRTYVSLMPTFPTFELGLNFVRQIYAPFGQLTDDQWQHMAEHSLIQIPDGTYRMHYDPRTTIFNEQKTDVNLWPCWLSVACPTLVLRGADSAIFPRDVCEQMIASSAVASMCEIPNAGHAPALMSDLEITIVRDWLMSH